MYYFDTEKSDIGIAQTEETGDIIYLHKGQPPKKDHQIAYSQYKNIIDKYVKGREKQTIISKIEKLLDNNVDPMYVMDDNIRSIYTIIKDEEEKKQIYIDNDDTMFPICIKNKFNLFYISGGTGSGKSTLAMKIIENYKKANKGHGIYLISRLEDPKDVLQKCKYIERIDCNSFLEELPTYEEFKDCMIVFDDFESYQTTNPKLYNIIVGLMNEMVTLGRHQNLNIIVCCHNVTNYKSTRLLLLEATHMILYPRSCSNHSLKYLFGTYGSMDTKQLEKFKKSQSRFICLYKQHPNILFTEHSIELL